MYTHGETRQRIACRDPSANGRELPAPNSHGCPAPEGGTQAQFRKRKPPCTYHYDSSLSPSLEWDSQNTAREAGEALLQAILAARTLENAKAEAEKLQGLSKPFL